jgi:hypothetical protein
MQQTIHCGRHQDDHTQPHKRPYKILLCCLHISSALLGATINELAHAEAEIWVHDNELSKQGKVDFTLHANHRYKGARDVEDGVWPAHHQSFLMAEFATGLTPNWELGLHLPFVRNGIDHETAKKGDWGATGAILRLKTIREHESGFFYGFNAEYGVNAKRVSTARHSSEFRGIVGYEQEHYKLVANPTLVWDWGEAAKRPDLNVDFKALHKINEHQAWGIESYTSWGRYNHLKVADGERVIFLVGEFKLTHDWLQLGIGQGYKHAPEQKVVKMMWHTEF